MTSQEAYAQWANRYPAAAHNAFMQIETDAMQQVIPDLHGKTVLDLACGTGRWGKYAEAQKANTIIGCDNSLEMLNHAVINHLVQAEFDALPFQSNAFDVILCGLAIGHINQPRLMTTLAEINRMLRQDGVAILSDLHPYQAWNGATRSFVGDDGKSYAVEHHIHDISTVLKLSKDNHLNIETIVESGSSTKNEPVVIVYKLSKHQTLGAVV